MLKSLRRLLYLVLLLIPSWIWPQGGNTLLPNQFVFLTMNLGSGLECLPDISVLWFRRKWVDCAKEMTTALQECPKARLILAIGIAWGNPNKAKFCDVLCSSKIYAYRNIKLEKSKVWPRDEEEYKLSQQMLVVFKKANDWAARASFTCAKQTEGGTRASKAFFGSMISWEALLNDQEIRDGMLGRHKEAIGGEMEGVQLKQIRDDLAAATPRRDIDFVIIKGVSDFADGNKDSRWQLTAALAAVNYAKYCLTTAGSLFTEEDHDGGVSHAGKTIQVDTPSRDDELSDLHKVLLKYGPKLVQIISNPVKLAGELVAEFLLSPDTQDDVSTTRGISRRDKANEIIGEVVRHFEVKKDDRRYFLKFCKVLKAHGQPGLRELAEEMERLSKGI